MQIGKYYDKEVYGDLVVRSIEPRHQRWSSNLTGGP
jgi:hypothetical protein